MEDTSGTQTGRPETALQNAISQIVLGEQTLGTKSSDALLVPVEVSPARSQAVSSEAVLKHIIPVH